uniref:Putative ovule protein n=1 Tax=Solanum chacoense TaxID=4108 RepID=A0A0V0H5W1_SOLCH
MDNFVLMEGIFGFCLCSVLAYVEYIRETLWLIWVRMSLIEEVENGFSIIFLFNGQCCVDGRDFGFYLCFVLAYAEYFREKLWLILMRM